MLGIEATPSDKEEAEPTQQTAPAHHGLLGDSLEQVFPQGEGSLLGGLGPPTLWVEGMGTVNVPGFSSPH